MKLIDLNALKYFYANLVEVLKGKADVADTNAHISDKSNPHEVTKTQVGLSKVENKSSEDIRGEITSDNVTDALGYTPLDAVGVQLNGKDLAKDSNNKINIAVDSYTKAETDAKLAKKEDNILSFDTWADYEKAKNTIPADTYFVVEEDEQDNPIPSHNSLMNRDANECHPIKSITGLQAELDKKTDATDTAVLKARVDQLVGEVPPGSADEIADARVMVDGKTSQNLGDAIRTQVSSLKETITTVSKYTAIMDAVYNNDDSINLISVLEFVPEHYRHYANGKIVPSGNYSYSKNFPTTEGTVYDFDSTTAHICFFDINEVYIGGTLVNQSSGGTTYGSKITVPSGTYFMCVSLTTATISDVSLKIVGDSKNINILSIMNFVNGKYRHFANGNIVNSASYSYSLNFKVKANEKFYCDSTTAHVCFFDEDDAYVSGVLVNQSSGGINYGSNFTIPDGVSQMCISLTTVSIPTTILKYDTGNGNASRMVVVDINGGGDYTSVVEAVANEPENTTIYIKPGVYIGTVEAFEKRVILKGEDRNTCIIRSTNGGYNYPAINCSCGYFENLTFDSQYTNGSADIPPTAETAAYAVHCEREYGVGKTLEIYHCTLKSDFFSALGIGVRKDSTLIINDSELINNQTASRGPAYADISGGKGLGALFLHDSVGEQGNSYVKIYNTTFKSTLGNAMCLYNARGGNNKVYCEFVNNTLYDKQSGLSNNLFKRGGTFGDVFVINGISHGNTNPELNAN